MIKAFREASFLSASVAFPCNHKCSFCQTRIEENRETANREDLKVAYLYREETE